MVEIRAFRGRRMGGKAGRLVRLLMAFGLVSLPGSAQVRQDIVGTWQGTLQVGKSQRIVVKIAKAGAGWGGVVYNLDSDLPYEGRKTTQMSLDGGVMRFAVAPADVSFEGKLSVDGMSAAGTWKQGAADALGLLLVRAEGDAVWKIPKEDEAMAKDADPDWEVATVKPSDPNDTNSGFQGSGRQLFFERETVESMLLMSYGVHKKQIVDAPDWIETERWDVRGTPDTPGQMSLKQYQGMVRKILAERFGLKAHTETRELGVYALTIAKDAPKLTTSTGSPEGQMMENDRSNDGQRTVQMTNATMSDFALVMKLYIDRPMVDQTGLTGRYDFAVKWTWNESHAPTDGTAAPSLFTAVREQMGLKLEAVRAPTDVLVIDHVERPGAN